MLDFNSFFPLKTRHVPDNEKPDAYMYACLYVYVSESDDGLSVTYVNSPVIRASAVIRGESLRQAEVSAFEDYHITSLFFHVVISLIWNIGTLHMEAITLRA